MDGLTFADHPIGHLMWPLVAVIALVASYPVIRERIAVLEWLKVGPSGLGGEFGGVLEKSDRTMAAATVPPPPPASRPRRRSRHKAAALRTTSPTTALRPAELAVVAGEPDQTPLGSSRMSRATSAGSSTCT